MSQIGQEHDLTTKKVSELKTLLKSRGLPTTGKKKDLVDRLQFKMDSSNAIESSNTKEETNCSKLSTFSNSPGVSFLCGSSINGRGDLYSTGESESEFEEIDMEPSKSGNVSDFPQKLVERLDEITKVTLSLQSQLTKYEQKIAQLELKNAQLEHMVSELAKGSLDYENERSNIVLYGVDKSEITNRNGSEKQATDEYALNFVQKYLPNYERTDIKTKIIQNDRSNDIIISMACSADAFKLTKRCRANGFTKIRQGLTKPERMISKSVTLRTIQLNSNLSKTSDKLYMKRHIHSIAKVKKNELTRTLAVFSPEFDLTNLNGTIAFKSTNMIRKTSNHGDQASQNEQRPQIPILWSKPTI